MKEANTPAISAADWEYRQILVTPIDKLMQSLDAEAKDGWELVCVTVEEPYYRAFLKRSKSLWRAAIGEV
jgi:hypothetical protein